MEKVLLSPQEILELIRKQPRMTSERFWMEVEKAQEFSPNEEPCSNGRSDYRDEYRIIDQLQECEAGVEARRAMSFEPRISRMVTDEQAMLARPVPGLAVPLPPTRNQACRWSFKITTPFASRMNSIAFLDEIQISVRRAQRSGAFREAKGRCVFGIPRKAAWEGI